MENIFSTDSFDAFKTPNGMTIQPKTGSTKKMSVIVTVLGLVFMGISFIDIGALLGAGDDASSEFVRITGQISFYVFRWGGIVLLVLGVLLYLLKNMPAMVKPILVDVQQKQVIIRGKSTPFTEISEVNHMTQRMMGKNMTWILMMHNGKKKPFTPGAFFTRDEEGLKKFLAEVNNLIKQA